MFKCRLLHGIDRPRHGQKDSAATHFVVVPCADAPYFARCCTWPKSRCRLLRPMLHMAKLPMQATSTDGTHGQTADARYFDRCCAWPNCRCTLLRPMLHLAKLPMHATSADEALGQSADARDFGRAGRGPDREKLSHREIFLWPICRIRQHPLFMRLEQY